MQGQTHWHSPPPASLLHLPNELLINIAYSLSTSDLWRLGRVVRRLSLFTTDYLHRYRYTTGLEALPDAILLKISRHLNPQKQRTRFARTSQRFYPLIMADILHHNILHTESGLLNYAAQLNLTQFARAMLHQGGKVDTQCGLSLGFMGKRPTPLVTAALHGNAEMVKLLLAAGASQFVDGMRIPLIEAIQKKHEDVALILARHLGFPLIPLRGTDGTALQFACKAKLFKLVRYYLEHRMQNAKSTDAAVRRELNMALCRVLESDAEPVNLLDYEVCGELRHVVLLLWRMGADPDVPVKLPGRYVVDTARGLAKRHLDPRVRALF